ncbi:MAG: hypothetical protein SFU56_00340 [Capsulimonadales bacterium]|nr:hypothetical protein [Capsulimonadales bacterium]
MIAETILNLLRADRFAALRGSAVSGRLPLREGLLNDLFTQVRRERDLPTRRLEIRLLPDNRFTLYLQPQVGFFHPNVKLDFELSGEVDFRGDGLLTLRSLGFLGGPTAQLVRTVLLRAMKLPDPAVTVEGNTLRIHVREALIALDAGELADLIRVLQFTTRPGILYVLFGISI